MEWLTTATDWILHLDDKLLELVQSYGSWTYVVLFAIVFCETGLVVTPFLPGDSLLFAAGALAGAGSMDLALVMIVLFVAAVLGDTVNYQVGHYLGPRVFTEHRQSRWLKKKHLDRTHEFFEKYGGKTIIIARFVPIVRTFAPFVAGVGAMTYSKFLFYNIIGAAIWVVSIVLAGYWFGGLPIIRNNFTIVIFAIIAISMLPAIIEYWRARRAMRAKSTSSTSTESA